MRGDNIMKDEIEQDYMAILISKKNIFSVLLFLILSPLIYMISILNKSNLCGTVIFLKKIGKLGTAINHKFSG